MSLENLDGEYKIESKSSYKGPFQLNSDGVTEIRNGLTHRKDKKGCTWESYFRAISDNEVEIESTVDPSTAPEDVMLYDTNGKATRDTITYKSILKAKIVDDKIVISGTIQNGNETTEITMTQI